MKKRSFRALALALSVMMALSLMPFAAAAAEAKRWQEVTELAPDLILTQENSRSEGGVYRQSFLLDYTPNGSVYPLVLYGEYLNGKSPIQTVMDYASEVGYDVVAAVNGDYFFTGSGIPTGMTIQNGRLVSSDGAWNAVGFLEDGTAVVGAPRLTITLTLPDGQEMPVYALNNVRTNEGVYLYSSDFDPTTGTTAQGTEIVLSVRRDKALTIGDTLRTTVLSAEHTNATPIGENELVISLTDANKPGYSLENIAVGDEIEIDIRTEDPVWEQVVWSCGAGNLLAWEGALTDEAKTEVAPRTVLGVREDGSFSILECDGRQSGLSAGISLLEAARMLLDAGCVTVVNLDGGGSSAIAAAYPGQEPRLISSPSDGAPRGCATYILFVSDGTDRGNRYGSVVYPRSAAMLPGAAVEVSAVSYNRYFRAFADVTDELEADRGMVEDGVFYAPDVPGWCTITTGDKHCQQAEILVVDRVESLKVTSGGAAVTGLNLGRGEAVDLDVTASDGLRTLLSSDDLFRFAVEGSVGEIDKNGLFIASMYGGTGTIIVSYGGVSVKIPVSVESKQSRLITGLDNETVDTFGAAEAAAVTETAAENVRYGFGSLKLTYRGREDDSAEYLFDEPLTVEDPSHLTVVARGSGNWAFLFSAKDDNDALDESDYPVAPFQLAGPGWQFVTAQVPENADKLLGFCALGEGDQTVWLDQLCAHYGEVVQDLIPPTVELTADNGVLTGAVSDQGGAGITAEELTLTVDGREVSFTFQNGALRAYLPADGELHRVTLLAWDKMGNLTRKSLDVGTPAAPTYSDLARHWSAPYVEYLHGKGVFSDAATFGPAETVNNAMAATMLSRYLGVNTDEYAGVTLPYEDASSIPGWALPHVKAMYALGIMKGSIDSKGRSVLNPAAPCSRAQIMTILGRTLSRGYSYGPCSYDDASSVPAWARDHVDLLTALGIVNGAAGKVNPTGTITRGEFAALLYRMD